VSAAQNQNCAFRKNDTDHDGELRTHVACVSIYVRTHGDLVRHILTYTTSPLFCRQKRVERELLDLMTAADRERRARAASATSSTLTTRMTSTTRTTDDAEVVTAPTPASTPGTNHPTVVHAESDLDSSSPPPTLSSSYRPSSSAKTSTATEKGGPVGPEPTRYGDWERGGRCSDF
jgi:hypothetical protein